MNILVLEKFINFNNNIKLDLIIKHNIIKVKKRKFQLFYRLKLKLIEILVKYPNLKTIVTPTTVVNHLDLDYINKNNIKLINLLKFKKKLKKFNNNILYPLFCQR